jgi:hypothetical protein
VAGTATTYIVVLLQLKWIWVDKIKSVWGVGLRSQLS